MSCGRLPTLLLCLLLEEASLGVLSACQRLVRYACSSSSLCFAAFVDSQQQLSLLSFRVVGCVGHAPGTWIERHSPRELLRPAHLELLLLSELPTLQRLIQLQLSLALSRFDYFPLAFAEQASS